VDDDDMLRVQRIMVKHPHYLDVCAELSNQAVRMNAYNGALKLFDRYSVEHQQVYAKFTAASWECMVLNETKRNMEAHAELQT
jgi:hypothetical protein